MPPVTVPAATCRLQFNAAFTCDAASAIVDCVDTLGISHGCVSSSFQAVPGGTHGYDVADPTQLNPEIGNHDTCDRWVNTHRAHGMRLIIDLVPGIDRHPLKLELEHT